MKPSGRPLPPLNALKAFEAAARLLSLTRAAEELNVTQGAVSQQVRLLEEYLETALFVRKHRRLELTDAARAYLPAITEAFGYLQIATNELFSTNERQLLTLRCGTSFGQRWLMPRIPDFYQQHPNIRIRLLSSVWAPQGTAGDEPDVEISNGRGNCINRIAEKLTDEHWMVVASPQFLEKHPVPETVAEILKMPLISTLGDRENWQLWFRRQGVIDTLPEPVLECDTSTMAVEAASCHAGLLLGRSFNIGSAMDSGELIQAHPFTMASSGSHYLILPNKALPEKSRIFCRWLVQQLTEAGAYSGQGKSSFADRLK